MWCIMRVVNSDGKGWRIMMPTQTQSNGSDRANGSDLARAKTMRMVAILLAVLAMAVLVYGFGMGWQPVYQVPAGLAAWAAVEWQRRCYHRIKDLSGKGN
jgi:hypothetical protein